MLQYEIWFHESKGLSCAEKRDLLARFHSAERIFDADPLDLPEKIARLWFKTSEEKKCALEAAERLMRENEKRGIQVLSIQDPCYRPEAKEHVAAPTLLYYLGTLPGPGQSIAALVGTRKATSYGIRATEYLCRQYRESGWVIASGLASGIEAAAHRFGAELGGILLGFAPHGLDLCNSGATAILTEKILTSGAVLSPFSIGVPPFKHHFVRRNEILCSWSDEIVMVEGDATSGAMAIGRMGLGFGKPVFAVPNQIFAHSSDGCNRLFQEGARPFILKRTGKDVSENQFSRKLSRTGSAIITLLKELPLTPEELAVKTNGRIDQIQAELLDLELQDLVRFQQDGKWHFTGW